MIRSFGISQKTSLLIGIYVDFDFLINKLFRFLDSFGKISKPEHFVPFGHGKRVCMGEPLAKAELLIFFVTLLQKLQFDAVGGKEPDPLNYCLGLTRVPNEFDVKVSQRFNK